MAAERRHSTVRITHRRVTYLLLQHILVRKTQFHRQEGWPHAAGQHAIVNPVTGEAIPFAAVHRQYLAPRRAIILRPKRRVGEQGQQRQNQRYPASHQQDVSQCTVNSASPKVLKDDPHSRIIPFIGHSDRIFGDIAARLQGASEIHTGTMGFGKMENETTDRATACMLERDSADGPCYHQDRLALEPQPGRIGRQPGPTACQFSSSPLA